METPGLTPGTTLDVGDGDAALPAPVPHEAELAALRARLREVEAALGLPARPGAPAPPALPALLHRVAALERQAGIVPGLVPLPGCGAAAPPDAPDAAAGPPRSRRRAWRERGKTALAALALLALLAWLLRPPPGGPRRDREEETAATGPAAAAPAPARVVAAPPAAPPGPRPPCDWVAYEGCAREDGRAPSPTTVLGATPCPPGGTAPCAARGGPAPAPCVPVLAPDDRVAWEYWLSVPAGAGWCPGGAPAVGAPAGASRADCCLSPANEREARDNAEAYAALQAGHRRGDRGSPPNGQDSAGP
jgi:hypothetical protein